MSAAPQRITQASDTEHGPLVRIMPWGQAVRWQLPVLMAQAQVRFAKQLHELLLGQGVTIGHSRVHELVTQAPGRLTVEVQFALCRVLNCSPSDLWLDLGAIAVEHEPDRSARVRMRNAKVVRAGEFL
jgi:DNA-binding Xre family transcriptional regulator